MSTAQEQFVDKLTEILDLTKQEDAYNWIGPEFDEKITELFHIRDILIIDIRQGLTSKREVTPTPKAKKGKAAAVVAEAVEEASVEVNKAQESPKPE